MCITAAVEPAGCSEPGVRFALCFFGILSFGLFARSLIRVVGAPGGALALLAHWFSVVTAPLRELQPTHRKDAFMVFVVGDVAALHAHRRVEIDPFFHFYFCLFPPHTSAPSSTVPIIRPSTNAMRQSQFMFSLPVHLPGSRHTSGQFPAQSRRSPRTRSGQALPEVHLLA